MLKGINLLTEARKQTPARQTQFLRLAKTGSVVLLVFYCLVAGGVFSFWFSTQRLSREVEEEIMIKKEQIADLKRIESLQVLLKQRLSALEVLSSEKSPDYKALLVYFDRFPPGEVTINEILLSAGGQISFSGQAVNSLTLANFLDSLSWEKNDLFSQVILSSVGRQKDGSYLFSLNLQAEGGNEAEKKLTERF